MTELTVSSDRTGIVVEMGKGDQWSKAIHSVTLSPDEARDIASQLNEQADAFEANAHQFPSRIVGSPR